MYTLATLSLISFCFLFTSTFTRTVGNGQNPNRKITFGLKCGNIAGVSFCNGTNDLYENSTTFLARDAKVLQRKMLWQSDISRNGYEPCPHGQSYGCTVLESVVIPTYITNSMGQPRFIYQNKHLEIVQKVQLSVCKSKQCGGYNKCQEHLHPVGLIAINPHRPHQLIVDTFIVPVCCSCEIPWISPGGPDVVLPPIDYESGRGPGPGLKPFPSIPSPPNFELPNPDDPHFVIRDSRVNRRI